MDKLRLTCLALIAILLVAPLTSTTTAETVTESATYASTEITENLTIESGATLVIDQDVSVSQGVTIQIDDGARLELVDANLSGQDVNSHLKLYTNSSVSIDTSEFTGQGTLRIHFVTAVNQSISVNATVQDTTEQEISGDYVDFSVNLSEDDLEVNMTHLAPFYLTVDKYQILTSDSQSTYFQPHEITINSGAFQQWMESSFTIENEGMLWTAGSEISGAQINCVGVCQIASTTFVGSAPIEVASEGEISIADSNILGSRSDEDIVVMDQGQITYNNNQGTGGMVDNWIRLVSDRIIWTNIEGAEIRANGLGYYPSSNQKVQIATTIDGSIGASFSDNTGDWVRIVEWQDGDGNYATEEATINITVNSGWGEFTTELSATPTSEIWANVSLPMIVVDDIVPSKSTAEINKPLGVNLSISNAGDAEAINPTFECYVGNDSADIGGYIQSSFYGTMGPGESLEIPFTWRYQYQGDAQITCSVLTPTGLEGYVDIITTDSPSSSVVSFYSPEEEESTPWIAFAIAGGALVAGLAVIARGQKEDEKEYETQITESSNTDIDSSIEEENLETSDD